VQGAIIRSGASAVMWFSGLIAYQTGLIRSENFSGVSFAVLYLILFNLPTLWILRHIIDKKLFAYFSLFINFLEVLGYTAIIHFLGGIEANYLLPIYAALIIYVGVVAPRKLPFIIAGFCVICFSLMVISEHYAILQTYKIHLSFQLPWPDQIMIMVVNANLLFVIAFISSHTAFLLKRNRDRLRRQNEDLRQAFQKASESDRLKSEFLANMSHELRTPLNAIIGFSELLECQYPGKLDESQKEYIRDINTSGKHLLAIISDILDLAKVEAGKMRMEPADVHVASLFDNGLVIFKEQALKHRIRLSTDITGCPETIRADELRLKQIVYNLLSNAVKFTPDGGQVILSARHLSRRNNHWFTKNGEVVSLPAYAGNEQMDRQQVVDIAVTDTGIGLKKEDLERIFKPFEQVDGSTTRRYQGTGLGLSLAKRLAELHGGYLCVESEGEEKGSSFHCVIPA
ncbi:MAG: sensor histidine kinase, partial [Syntrophales bacterium]